MYNAYIYIYIYICIHVCLFVYDKLFVGLTQAGPHLSGVDFPYKGKPACVGAYTFRKGGCSGNRV